MNFKKVNSLTWPDVPFNGTDVLILSDHLNDEYTNSRQFNNVKQTETVLILDHYSYYENLPSSSVLFPGYLLKTCNEFYNMPITNYPKIKCFNFMINKKRINRALLIGLITYFNLDNYLHTWTWKNNYYNDDILMDFLELDDFTSVEVAELKEYGFNSDRLNVELNVLELNGQSVKYCSDEEVRDVHNTYLRYNNGLDAIFNPSVVSLITEPVGIAKSIMYTEKTLYAILGSTFPIWIGGYRQANEFQKLGFDVFDDVIDHSYQYEEHFVDRCFLAIKNNIKILTDFHYALECSILHKARLLKNKEYAQSQELSDLILSKVKHLPDDIVNELVLHHRTI